MGGFQVSQFGQGFILMEPDLLSCWANSDFNNSRSWAFNNMGIPGAKVFI
jgi:hypothetical protein